MQPLRQLDQALRSLVDREHCVFASSDLAAAVPGCGQLAAGVQANHSREEASRKSPSISARLLQGRRNDPAETGGGGEKRLGRSPPAASACSRQRMAFWLSDLL